MAKLIGTDPNQVPSNADLGSAAFMDAKEFLLSRGSSLSAINTTINRSSYVQDVLVYNTANDSDGGAWRHRTQNCSWHKEELNTPIRGSRREFPAVALIVALQTPQQIVIYDADDPTLPMWRILKAGNATLYPSYFWDGEFMSLDAINGHIFLGNRHSNSIYSGNGLYEYNLIGDKVLASVYSYTGKVQSGTFSPFTGGVRTTNTGNEQSNFTRPFNLGNYSVNDIAVTILPDAPIDDSTKLPRPTIAVAHQGGVTIVRDDKDTANTSYPNWTNTYNSWNAGGLTWHKNNLWIFKIDDWYRIWKWIPNGTTTSANLVYESHYLQGIYPFMGNGGIGYNKPVDIASTKYDGLAFGFAGSNHTYGEGLSRMTDEPDSNDNLVNYTTTTYNTGWMFSDCKVAALADTEEGDRRREQLVTNGDFSSGTSSWSGSAASLSVSSGQLTVTGTASVPQNQNAFQNSIPVRNGRKYILRATIVSTNASSQVGFNVSGLVFDNFNGYKYYSGTFPKEIYETVMATSDVVNLGLHTGINVGSVSTFDNVSLSLAEENRTVYKNGLEVYGTIKKTPVAAGADLVGYSGFSSTNQLIQGVYNSQLDFGTGDFCYMMWARHKHDGTTTAYYFFDRADTDGTNRIGAYYIPHTQRIDMYTPSGQAIASGTVEPMLEDWTHIAFVRRNSVGYIYMNGRLLAQNSMTENVSSSDGTGHLRIGARFNGAEPWSIGDIALFRASDNAPSHELIQKIYNDEKYLFMENAKCTLYGSDDEVDAVAYDSRANLLHAGTSSGRSTFQGLCRVDNSTTPVSTAISASNKIVLED
jgi:hypothetical protein